MEKMLKRYGYKQSSELNKLTLVSQLDNIKKGLVERISSYHLWFKNALGVLSFQPSSIMLLYMRNLQEPSLVEIILKMGNATSPEWNNITDIDGLRDKVEDYLEEYGKFQACLPCTTAGSTTGKSTSSQSANTAPSDQTSLPLTSACAACAEAYVTNPSKIKSTISNT